MTPNPANDRIMVQGQPATDAAFQLLAPTGRVARQMQWPGQQATLTMETADLPGGVYFYRVLASGKVVQNGKLVIAH